MKVPNHQEHGEVGFNMTPMIDVVFLLIIFFLVSSHLAKQEAQLELPLPVADSGSRPLEQTGRHVIVNVLQDGSVKLAGRTVTESDLQQRLNREREESEESLEVKIRADRGVPYRAVEPVMLACQRAGIWNVTYSVYRSKDIR